MKTQKTPPAKGAPPELKKKLPDKKYGYPSNLKFIFTNQWRFKKRYIITTLASSPMAALNAVVAAFLPKIVLDCIEKQSSPSEMVTKIGFAALLSVVLNVAWIVLNRSNNRDRIIAENGLFQLMLFNKTIDMDYNNYVFNETRVMKEKANQALRGWSGSVTSTIKSNTELFSSVFGFASFTAIIAKCNILFIPILIASYGISSLGWYLLQKYRDSKKDEWSGVFQKLGYMTFRSKDFTSAKDIRVYNMADFLERKTEKHLNESLALQKKMENGHLMNVLLEDFLKFGISLAAYAYLTHMKLTTDMSLGDFSLYFGAITGFGVWLSKMVDGISDVVDCDHCVNDFRNFLDLKDTMNTGNGVNLPTKTEMPLKIELKSLSFTYDGADKPTINGIDLTIEPGERIAIVGVNGAGKSTLVKLISGLFIPQEGEILINGINSRNFNRDEYYSLFSTVFQDVSLLPSSVAKNIALCEQESIDTERLWECMRLAGIDEKVRSLPDRENTLLIREVNEGATAFSGGELQRLILARAIYKDAPIIILDEPTAALDPIAENNMYLKYSELTEGKTSIYISHRLSSTRFCNRIILLDDNKIAEIGTHEELIALGGKYAEMFMTQSQYYRDGEVEI